MSANKQHKNNDNEEDEDSSETTSWKSPSMSESTPREGRSSAKRQAPRSLSQSPLTPLTYHYPLAHAPHLAAAVSVIVILLYIIFLSLKTILRTKHTKNLTLCIRVCLSNFQLFNSLSLFIFLEVKKIINKSKSRTNENESKKCKNTTIWCRKAGEGAV